MLSRSLHSVARALLGVLATSLLVLPGLVLATSAPAAACACATASLRQQADRADAVFLGTVDEIADNGRRVTLSVTATKSYKGTVERSVEVHTNTEASACGLGKVARGSDYLFFVNGDAQPYNANSCGGSGPVATDRVARVEKILGAGESIAAPPPPAPTLTKVEDSPPPPVARMAAPGAALAIIGLLGLLLLRLRRRA